MPSTQEVPAKIVNSTFLERLYSDDPGQVKQANDAVNEFTRVRMREDGFLRKILPPIPISNDELDRQVDTELPVKVVDKEPNSPAAISVPFASLPINRYIRGPRYRVMFQRIMTPKFTKDVDELRTYHMDIRQVLSDNAIKDMLAEEDSKGLSAVNGAMIGPGQTVPETNNIHWVQLNAGIHRSSLQDGKKILPKANTHLEAATALINNITIKDVEKWDRTEAGGNLSEEILIKGFGERNFQGMNWIVTIKTDLVPTNTIFYFADPKFLGKFYVLADTTMFLKREAFFLEFFAWESIGAAFQNVGGVGRVDFTGTGTVAY